MITMTHPEITTLDRDYPALKEHPSWDPHWVWENLEHAAELARTIPRRYADAEVTQDPVRQWVRDVVERAVVERRSVSTPVASGPSLLLLGGTGVGKTREAYGAVRALSVSGIRVAWRFVAAADLYAKLRPRHLVDSEEVFETYANARLLILDDLGAAKGTEWNEEINYRLVNHRYEHELPTIFTSNVPPKDLSDALGDRVGSRLVEMAERVVIKGGDRRREKVAA